MKATSLVVALMLTLSACSADQSAAPGASTANKIEPPPPPPMAGEGIACPMDAKQCSDGSFVSRSGPRCEFAACPEDKK